MINKARKHVNRVGLQAVKVLFTADIRRVRLPSSVISTKDPNPKVSVCFERGGKMAASADKVY